MLPPVGCDPVTAPNAVDGSPIAAGCASSSIGAGNSCSPRDDRSDKPLQVAADQPVEADAVLLRETSTPTKSEMDFLGARGT
jgi:hypothetical protein